MTPKKMKEENKNYNIRNYNVRITPDKIALESERQKSDEYNVVMRLKF